MFTQEEISLYDVDVRTSLQVDKKVALKLQDLKNRRRLGEFLTKLITGFFNDTLDRLNINGEVFTKETITKLIQDQAAMQNEIATLKETINKLIKEIGAASPAIHNIVKEVLSENTEPALPAQQETVEKENTRPVQEVYAEPAAKVVDNQPWNNMEYQKEGFYFEEVAAGQEPQIGPLHAQYSSVFNKKPIEEPEVSADDSYEQGSSLNKMRDFFNQVK